FFLVALRLVAFFLVALRLVAFFLVALRLVAFFLVALRLVAFFRFAAMKLLPGNSYTIRPDWTDLTQRGAERRNPL
ncbi:MAG: hypothetical protein IIA27_00940, partial [Gemmatimonadetes bacterium]|nr:hypothetical protein [Gemmatimonadota bacterium]